MGLFRVPSQKKGTHKEHLGNYRGSYQVFAIKTPCLGPFSPLNPFNKDPKKGPLKRKAHGKTKRKTIGRDRESKGEGWEKVGIPKREDRGRV